MSETTIGERYLRRTVYEATELFTATPVAEEHDVEPPRFKVYRGVPRIPLPGGLPLRLADARGCVDGPPRDREWDAATVSALTHYSYGLSRRDEGPGAVWPLHRLVASARCLFPTELYLWIPPTGDLPGGLHHYDPLHHTLEQLRSGDLRDDLSGALGAGPDGCRAVLLVTSMLWKNAFMYHSYSYRLCSQEAGMVVGNSLLVAAALGLRGTVHHRFDDASLAHLLGLDAREEQVFAAVTLHDRSAAPPAERTGPSGRTALRPIHTSFAGMEAFGREFDPLLAGIAEHSTSVRPAPDPAAPGPAAPDGGARCDDAPSADLPEAGRSRHDFDLAVALRARCSGNVMFNPRSQTLAAQDLAEMLHGTARPYDTDLRPGGGSPAITALVVVVDVDGVDRGAYRYCPEHARLHTLGAGDVGSVVRRLQGSASVPNLNLCAANAVVYLAADTGAALREHGDRGYRIMTMEAGLVAQRLSVLGAACGLAVRIHNGYDAAEVERALGIEATPLTPLFQIALAHNRPGVQYGLRVLF